MSKRPDAWTDEDVRVCRLFLTDKISLKKYARYYHITPTEAAFRISGIAKFIVVRYLGISK